MAQDQIRKFVGHPALLSTDRSAGNCAITPQNETLTLLLANGFVSNIQGSCRIPVLSDGSFVGQCNFPYLVVQVNGKIMADTIYESTKDIGPNYTCERRTILKELR